ncbi:MAG: nucleotide exchange factor GrpE [Fimbriimonadaceae bacterium]|nr:nucleotide exchange factor GrpE [Chitinophagales bacterium]
MSKKHQQDIANDLEDQQKQSLPEEELTENILAGEENESSSLINELEEQKEKYIRLLAEFENYKRRTAKERIDLFKVAGQEVIKDLLPALDDIDRATIMLTDTKDPDAMKQGLELISEKIKNTLAGKGLKEIDCKGKDFDVDTMESITEIPAPSEELKGKVIDVVQKGYTLNDKIIRYAKVVVGK